MPIGPLVKPIQLSATSRSTSAKDSVTMTKNGPCRRSVMAPIRPADRGGEHAGHGNGRATSASRSCVDRMAAV